jgi:2-polyprenyl-3-methyl-5-hydroxy-6-metoxy-1,4-benzoquinol methylase
MTCTAAKESPSTASVQSNAGLCESYVRWRASQPGRITDALETELILELLGPVAGLKLLDVGCGDGVFASELARRGADVTGLDADADMVTVARKRTEAEPTQLHFVEGKAETLPFDDAAFDDVVAVTVLCFVPDAERAVAGRLGRDGVRTPSALFQRSSGRKISWTVCRIPVRPRASSRSLQKRS